MANFNKVIIAGRLTRSPELKYTLSNMAICEFGLAVNEKWKSKDGQDKEETCFTECVCWGKQAEVFNQYMAKGREVLIEGKLKFEQWEDKDGNKRSKHKISVQNFQFLGSKDDSQQKAAAAPPMAKTPPPMPPNNVPQGPPPDDVHGNNIPTGPDIPF